MEEQILRIFESYREVNQVFFQLMTKAAGKHNLTAPQLIVLRVLHEQPAIRLSELADKLFLGNSTTSGIVERMAKAGLVERARTPSDRRAMTLTLTGQGEALWRETEVTRVHMMRSLLELSEADRRELDRLQHEVLRLLRKSREEA
ncbi:MarR family winged helix-turn-helix transcriptional regulator [Paenibacillus sp. GCM10023250]|uniref:MarR family winged helix-turn-helix transcriptional regulator n=1 Tax=Paenibacillus sp. GCM10023250 TaxID=3252648 RepID=UPI003616EC30